MYNISALSMYCMTAFQLFDNKENLSILNNASHPPPIPTLNNCCNLTERYSCADVMYDSFISCNTHVKN